MVSELLRRVEGVRIRACGEGREALEASLEAERKGGRVEVVAADEGVEDAALVQGATAVVWCVSSYQAARPYANLLGLFGPAPGADKGGVGGVAAALRNATALLRRDAAVITPKFVLLSTAAASRVGWSRERCRARPLPCPPRPRLRANPHSAPPQPPRPPRALAVAASGATRRPRTSRSSSSTPRTS